MVVCFRLCLKTLIFVVFFARFSGQISTTNAILILLVTLSGNAIYGKAMALVDLYRQWKRLEDIPGPTARPFLAFVKAFGFSSKSTQKMGTLVAAFQKQHGLAVLYHKEKMFKMFTSFRPYVFCCAPETIQPILSSTVSLKKTVDNDIFKGLLGEGLVFSGGSYWKKHRKILNSCFRKSALDGFLPIMNEQVRVLVTKLETHKQDNNNNNDSGLLQKLFLCTFDVVCQATTGTNNRSQEMPSSFCKDFIRIVNSCMLRERNYWFLNDFLFNLLPAGRWLNREQMLLHKNADAMIDKRRRALDSAREAGKEDSVGSTFLDVMLTSGFTDEEVREEVYTLISAGTDTTASATQFMLFMLGLHQEVQERAYQEVSGLMSESPDCEVTPEDIKNATYLECVVKECMRMFPPPKLGRVLEEDTMIGGHLIPEGTNCVVFLYALHHDPDVFPDPERFDPERFLPENVLARQQFAYLPFSVGPRNCIGRQFASLEEKVLLFHILRKFVIKSLDPLDKIALATGLVLKTRKPLRIQFHPR